MGPVIYFCCSRTLCEYDILGSVCFFGVGVEAGVNVCADMAEAKSDDNVVLPDSTGLNANYLTIAYSSIIFFLMNRKIMKHFQIKNT